MREAGNGYIKPIDPHLLDGLSRGPVVKANGTQAMTTVRYIYLLLLLVGPGSMVFFSEVAAPGPSTLFSTSKLAETFLSLSPIQFPNPSYIIIGWPPTILFGGWVLQSQTKPIHHFIRTDCFVIAMFLVTRSSQRISSHDWTGGGSADGIPERAAATQPAPLLFGSWRPVSVWLSSSRLLCSVVQRSAAVETLD